MNSNDRARTEVINADLPDREEPVAVLSRRIVDKSNNVVFNGEPTPTGSFLILTDRVTRVRTQITLENGQLVYTALLLAILCTLSILFAPCASAATGDKTVTAQILQSGTFPITASSGTANSNILLETLPAKSGTMYFKNLRLTVTGTDTGATVTAPKVQVEVVYHTGASTTGTSIVTGSATLSGTTPNATAVIAPIDPCPAVVTGTYGTTAVNLRVLTTGSGLKMRAYTELFYAP